MTADLSMPRLGGSGPMTTADAAADHVTLLAAADLVTLLAAAGSDGAGLKGAGVPSSW